MIVACGGACVSRYRPASASQLVGVALAEIGRKETKSNAVDRACGRSVPLATLIGARNDEPITEMEEKT